MQTLVTKQKVLFLTGRRLSSVDYRELESSLSAEIYIAEALGEAFEELLLKPYTAVVLTERFAAFDLTKLCAAIRATKPDIPLIIIGNTSHETMNRILARFDHVQFNDTEDSVSELLTTLRSAERGAMLLRGGSHSKGEKMTLSEWIFGSKAESQTEIQLRTARQVLQQLLHSSSQGKGVGALVSYLDLMEATAVPSNEGYHIGQNIFLSLVENAVASRAWIGNLEKALQALTSEAPLMQISGHEFSEIIKAVLAENYEATKIKRHVLAVEFMSLDGSLLADAAALADVIHELVINALKYSPEGTLIRLTAGFRKNRFAFRIQNEYDENEHSGSKNLNIAQKELTVPFVKLGNQIDDRFARFKYGIGIGLTVCAFKVRQMNGDLELFVESAAVSDFSKPGSKKLAVELTFAQAE